MEKVLYQNSWTIWFLNMDSGTSATGKTKFIYTLTQQNNIECYMQKYF